MVDITLDQEKKDFIAEVEKLSEQKIMRCYQCGRCSAGCPLADYMDLLPNQVIKYVQLGMDKEVLECNTIWVCATCYRCSVVCPKDIDIARLMEALRLLILRDDKAKMDINKIKKEEYAELPQIALVASMRKYTP